MCCRLHHDPVLGRAYVFQSRQHRFAPRANVVVDQVGMAGLEPASPCSQSTWVRRYPTSRKSVRTAGFEPAISCTPSRRDGQTSLRSAVNGSCGSRTRLFGLKGRRPQPIDERAVASAHLPRSWITGDARTVYAVGREVLEPSCAAFQAAATPSQLPGAIKKPGVACDTGFFVNPF